VDTSLVAALGLGFLLGVRHALEADHVAAVSTFVSQDRSILRSCLRGTFWGIGHTAALLAAGVAVLAFKLKISPETERSIDGVVGLVLVLLGGHVLLRAFAAISLHRHQHSHGGPAHSHLHVHVGDGPEHRHLHVHVGDAAEHRHLHVWQGAPQPLLMGMLHGLAGSGALVLLVLASMPSPLAAFVYILVFGVGSTAGMLVLSGLIGVPFALTAGSSRTLATALQVVVGASSVLVGLLMVRAGLSA
jgi:ABC-type nickel/cobalt efflux system permease component RcnA